MSYGARFDRGRPGRDNRARTRLPVPLLASVLLVVACSAAMEPSVGRSPRSDPRIADSPPTDAPATSQAPAYSNTLRWTTASEHDNFGFDVYRGESPDGPFHRLTTQPLLGAGSSDETREYRYVDSAIDPSQRYFYYVESIAMDGSRARFTPIREAAATAESLAAPSASPAGDVTESVDNGGG